MKKYTATFTCDRLLWDEFKVWAHSCNSSASEQLSKFMQSCLLKEVDEKTHNYIDSVIDNRIEKFVDERLNILIDRRYIEGIRVKLNQKSFYDDGGVTIDLKSDTTLDDNTDNTDTTDSTDITDNTDTTDITDSTDNSNNNNVTDTTDNTDNQKKINSLSGENKIRRLKDKPQAQIFNDAQVGDSEQLSPSTIYGYRKRGRTPKDKTFLHRWNPTPDGKGWIKLQNVG